MILRKETYDKFGYYPEDLKRYSDRKILAKCENCGKIRELTKSNYRDLCFHCGRRTEEKRNKLRNFHMGLHPSLETRQKMSNSHKGMKPSLGYHHTEEAKQKIGESNVGNKNCMYGKHHTKETKEKMRKSHCDVSGKNNPNWQGGKSFEPYCIRFDDEFKERVREYFGRCCYICAKNEKDNKAKLSVHHVSYNKETCCDNSKPLFVPLCKSCHNKTNYHREYWEEFFTISLDYLTDGECYIKKQNNE